MKTMKQLNELLLKCQVKEISGDTSGEISDIAMDSRVIRDGSLFIAVKGTHVDGHEFIQQAVEKGARAVVCEEIPSSVSENVTYILVDDSAESLGYIASAFYDFPSEKLILTGITGTNGKTTVATLLYEVFRSLGYKTGLLSTVVNKINENIIPSTHTTPDQISVNRLLSLMVEEGCTHCFMEVSSHAIDQKRISGLDFNTGVFTNLTHDHLDYHKDFKSYRDAKKKFFDSLPASAIAISNADDPNGSVMLQNTKARKVFYALRKPVEIKGVIIENSMEGLQLKIGRNEVHFHLRGKFNAYNLLGIYGVCMFLGLDEQTSLTAMSNLRHVDGRFHPVANERNIYAFVDYAHTPDAIENVLKTLDELRSRNETLFVIVGAGGNRDRLKRPVMAAIAARFADRLILTSDNPRDEEPQFILDEMKKGLDSVQLSHTMIIQDRYEAIKTACLMAKQGDIILVAGKGHETYQEIKGVRYPFDDKKVLSELLKM